MASSRFIRSFLGNHCYLALLIFAIGLSSALWAVFRVISYSLYYTRQLPWLAKSVRKVHRTKGERLLGIIEIAEEEKIGTRSYSAQIFKAAQDKMAKEIKSLELGKIFPWKRIRIPSECCWDFSGHPSRFYTLSGNF